MRLALLVIAALLLPLAAHAEGPFTSSALGYWSTTGCPAGTSPCFLFYDTTGAGIPVNPPSSSTTVGITPVVTAALAATLVLKNAAGNLYGVYASNLTGGTSGYLQVFNATSAPADGAVAPVVCVPFAGGAAQAAYLGVPPAVFSTGITAVISSATVCTTKTTGVLTGFISGLVK